MVTFKKDDVSLVVPVGSLESLYVLQTALLQLVGRQTDAEPIEPEQLAAVASLLQATLFDVDQLAKIEAMFQKRAVAKPLAEAA